MYIEMIKKGETTDCLTLLFTYPDESLYDTRFTAFAKKCRNNAQTLFGDNPLVNQRLEKELDVIYNTNTLDTFEMITEIVTLSKENGYPITLFGEEAGLLISYVLGISNVHPNQYGFFPTSSDIVLHKFEKEKNPVLTLAIAPPIQEWILPRLQTVFSAENYGEFEILKKEDSFYDPTFIDEFVCIDLLPISSLTTIRNLSLSTGFSYQKIPLDNERILGSLQKDICENELHWNISPEVPETLLDVAKYYAYAKCTSSSEKTFDSLKEIGDFVFRDTLFEKLIQLGIDNSVAFTLMRLWKKIDSYKEMLEKANAPSSLLQTYEQLSNLWSQASCLSRLNLLAMLKYYQLQYPTLFGNTIKIK